MINSKTEEDFEKFAILLLKSKTYKTLALRLLNSVTAMDVSEQNIRKEISELVGRYTRLRRPSDKSFRQLEQALVDYYKGLRKNKVNDLEERIIKRENQWSSLPNTDSCAKVDEGTFTGAQKKLDKCTENIKSLKQDMDLRNTYTEDSVNELKSLSETRTKLSNIQKLHEKQAEHISKELDNVLAFISKIEASNQLEKEKKFLMEKIAAQTKKLHEMREKDNQKIKSLSEEIRMLNETYGHKNEEFFKVQEENETLKEKLVKLEKENYRLQKENDTYRHRNEEILKVQEENGKLKEKLVKLEKENECLMDVNTELVDYTREDYEGRIKALDIKIEECERKIKTLRIGKKKAKMKNVKLESKINDLTQEIQQLKDQIPHHLPSI